MVHVRLNDHEANPNPHINFITPLKMADSEAEDEARQLLRALAAQVRPVMKEEGFTVNSFEEYEHNSVFAGRNWNNGEVVELVLRGADGAFQPMSWLLSTLCHELAHIKHMNHGPAFQKLWAKLRDNVRELQSKGYYGDGFWSSGTRLADFARMGGQGLDTKDLPEYMCGGAQSRGRPRSLKRRRRQGTGPSGHTGAQTAKKRKAGSRVTAQGLFKGSGRALNDGVDDDEQKKAGTGFRKKAVSKRAREERAAAAERRLMALQADGADPTLNEETDDEEGSECGGSLETDQDRRHTMLGSADESELNGLKTWQRDYSSDFIFPPVASASTSKSSPQPTTAPAASFSSTRSKGKGRDLGIIEISSDEDGAATGCDVQLVPKGGSATTLNAVNSRDGSRKKERSEPADKTRGGLGGWLHGTEPSGTASPARSKEKLSYGTLVRDEVSARKKESLGMSGPGKRLGSGRGAPSSRIFEGDVRTRQESSAQHHGTPSTATVGAAWSCQVCTLDNEPAHLACSACATPRGEAVQTTLPNCSRP